ncbi:uncharacterized protein EV154DRAFT_567308 [Mucor mucedo]|uniref:uncharacterized protein n=1 Tax=Mucor mucedo TaxID=29922 RepID=UPI002220E6CE|nr:uncharacterized protein EV154DRAFT_567308 [Mucor mucedo]KAI7887604.1 hypothetical protein EV154DRAFT_567308 [Mucor mucedo]
MSYFTNLRCNDWDLDEAINALLSGCIDKNEAIQKVKQQLLELITNVNINAQAKKKAVYLLKKLPPAESTSSTMESAISYSTYNMNDSSNIGNINNYINNYGKRVNDIFNTPGGENSEFVNKLLKTTTPNQENEDLYDLQNNEGLEDEDKLQENVIFVEEDLVEKYSKLNSIIKDWKAKQNYEPLIHKQQLLYYNIIDTSLNTSPLTKEDLDWITKIDNKVYIPLPHTEPLDFNLNDCTSFKSLKKFYDNNKHKIPYVIKKIIKTYINQRYEEHVNLFTDYKQKEDDYKFHFIAPLFKALFGLNENIKKAWGESSVGKTKVDGLLSIVDDEGLIAMFSAVEVSGPWYLVDNNHFMKDKKKLAKNLKLMLNAIYKLNISGGSNITKIKMYGIQLYQKQFYIYSLQMICPKLYTFKEELRFDYPTSPALFRSQLPIFFKNMLFMKNCIESSLENILNYMNDTDAVCSGNASDERFTDSPNDSPQKNKN